MLYPNWYVIGRSGSWKLSAEKVKSVLYAVPLVGVMAKEAAVPEGGVLISTSIDDMDGCSVTVSTALTDSDGEL